MGYFRLCDLRAGLAIFLTKLKKFSKNIKCNLIIFTSHNLLSKDLKQENKIGICYI